MAVDARREFTDRAALAATRHDVDQTESLVFVIALDAERQAENLETSTDRHDVRAVAYARPERRPSKQVRGQSLGTVLSPAEQIERRVGDGVVESHADQLHVDAAAASALVHGETVAPVAVGTEEFGVKGTDRRHASDLANQSLKAV